MSLRVLVGETSTDVRVCVVVTWTSSDAGHVSVCSPLNLRQTQLAQVITCICLCVCACALVYMTDWCLPSFTYELLIVCFNLSVWAEEGQIRKTRLSWYAEHTHTYTHIKTHKHTFGNLCPPARAVTFVQCGYRERAALGDLLSSTTDFFYHFI